MSDWIYFGADTLQRWTLWIPGDRDTLDRNCPGNPALYFFPIQSMEEGPGRCLCWIPQAVTELIALQNVRFPVCPGLGKSHSKFVTALSFPHHRQHRRERLKEHPGRAEIKDSPVAWFAPLSMKLCDLNYMSVPLPCQKDKWVKMKGISEQLWERRHHVFGYHYYKEVRNQSWCCKMVKYLQARSGWRCGNL